MRKRFALDLPFGANLQRDGTARFALWAPAAGRVELELRGRGNLRMQRSEDGRHSVQAACEAGQQYRFRVDCGIDAKLAVPDPAARAQAGDVQDFSVLVDPEEYEWQHPDWPGRPWREIVIYELHVGCFGGSFDAVRERLPALVDLGVTAIELMPLADFPGTRNWGYDGVLPFAPDASYGGPAALKELIDAAHGLGLCVYLDVVYNHFGPEGNYLHAYAPSFFDPEHPSPWGSSIDFRAPRVREFFLFNALYWLQEYRFDGLRLDAVHAIRDTSFLDELAQRVHAATEPGRHVHLMLENEANDARRLRHGYDAQWNDDAHNVLHRILTGETESYYRNFLERPAAHLARCLAEGFAYQGEASPSHRNAPRGFPSADLPPTRFILFLQNHDQVGNRAFGERLIDLCDAEALRAATVLQMLCPQIPLLFMGEECAARSPFLFFTDFHDQLAVDVREGRRREFEAFRAFHDPSRRTSIPDPNERSSFEKSAVRCLDTEEALECRNLYRALLQIRRQKIVPFLDDARSMGADTLGPAAVQARWRLGPNLLWIGVNFAEQAVAVDAPPGEVLFESRTGTGACILQGNLPAQSCCAFYAPNP